MSFRDVLKNSFVEGFTQIDISTNKIVATLAVTCILAFYIFVFYKFVTRKTFYSKTFAMSVALIAVITAGIILAMQSSIVISLGMVGALSIIRFRTAIKDPLDLIFLFWSISVGIICGAGMYEIAVIVSLIVTVGMLILEIIPVGKASMILVVNAKEKNTEKDIIEVVKKYSKSYKVKSRNISKNGLDIVIEVRSKNEYDLANEVSNIQNVESMSLLAHDGEVTF